MPFFNSLRTPLSIIVSTLVLCLLSIIGNYLSVPLMFGIDFIFGSIFTLYALFTLGALPALVIALAGGIYTLVLWGHPYALVIFVIETITISVLVQKGYKNMVITDLLYWCVIGTPLVLLFYVGMMSMEIKSAGMIALKQTFNGVFNALCAHLLILMHLFFGKNQRDFEINFEKIVYYPLLSIIILVGGAPLIIDGYKLRNSLQIK